MNSNSLLPHAGTALRALGLGAALALAAVPSFGQTYTWAGGSSAAYFTAANWSPSGINFTALNNATLVVGRGNPNNPTLTGGSLSIGARPGRVNVLTGGRLTVAGNLYPYNSDSLNGAFTVNALGVVNFRSNPAAIKVGAGGLGQLLINGGSFTTLSGLSVATGTGGRALVTVAGGALNVGGGTGTDMDLNLANGAGLTARLNITGGAVVVTRNLNIGSGGSIFISSIGQLTIGGDKRAQLNGLVASGQLTCPAGQTLEFTYNGTNTLAAIYHNPNSLYRETPTQVLLNNGVTGTGALLAVIDKATSNIVSLKLNGVETLNQLGNSRKGSYYDLTTSAGFETIGNCTFTVTKETPDVVDVSFKRVYDPGTGQVTPVDADIHYVINKQDTGLYTYSVLEHRPAYPKFDLGSWRQVLWIAQDGTNYLCEKIYTDSLRSWQMPSVADFNAASATPVAEIVKLNTGVRAGKYDGKYEYSLPFWETPLYGHASDVNHIGSWIVLGSEEFFNEGPTFHDLNAAAGILHVCMNGVHYNAKGLEVQPGEQWRKMYGPYLIYTSTGATADDNWAAAQRRTQEEKAKWPYAWLTDNAEYPLAAGRGSLTGRFVIQDRLKPSITGKNAWIGVTQLSNPDQQWQFEEKNYQYWVKTDAQGNFNLANVRPGTYSLFAYTDGEVGEYSQQNVTVTAGTATSLGTVTWNIGRDNGQLLFEIGVPDRKAGEYKFGDFAYAEGFVQDKFNTTFANPIEYNVKDRNWATALPYAQSPYPTSATTQVPWKWRLNFNLPATLPTSGNVTLTLAFASSDRSNEFVYVNDETRTFTTFYPDNGGGNAFIRQSNYAKYGLKRISIPISRLRPGANTITLMMASSQAMANHVMYDYISLEGDITFAPLSLNTVATAVTCPGSADGRLTATFGDGIPGYQIKLGAAGTYAAATSPYAFANLAAGTYTVFVKDLDGAETSQTVTIGTAGVLPEPRVAASRLDATTTGGTPETVYLGYGAQQLTLTATGTTYAWSPAAALSSSTGASVAFAPTQAGTYTYTVLATSALGCTTVTTITLTVVDARCGSKNDKVQVCHNGQPLCISPNAVPAHLRNHPGDQLGSCAPARPAAKGGPASGGAALEAYPNPFTASATLRFRAATAGPAQVRVYNMLGQPVATLFDQTAQAGQAYELTLNGERLASGLYTCQLRLNGTVETVRLTLMK